MVMRRTETFEPEDLALLGSIFDETWASIEAAFEHADEGARAAARTRLAELLLQLAGHEASHDHIRQTVLHVFLQTPITAGRPRSNATSSP